MESCLYLKQQVLVFLQSKGKHDNDSAFSPGQNGAACCWQSSQLVFVSSVFAGACVWGWGMSAGTLEGSLIRWCSVASVLESFGSFFCISVARLKGKMCSWLQRAETGFSDLVGLAELKQVRPAQLVVGNPNEADGAVVSSAGDSGGGPVFPFEPRQSYCPSLGPGHIVEGPTLG